MVLISWGFSFIQVKGICFGFYGMGDVLNICKYIIGLCTVEWGISQNSFEYTLGKIIKCCLN